MMGVVANVLDYNIVVSEFKHQLHYYVHFQTNISLYAHYMLNSTTTVLLQRWLWH